MSQLKKSMKSARPAHEIETAQTPARIEVAPPAPPPAPAKGELVFTAADLGRLIPRRGIYAGLWQPDRNGPAYDVFAAAEDLSRLIETPTTPARKTEFAFNHAADAVNNLDIHGHRGGAYYREENFYRHQKTHRYMGQWMIPPLVVMGGCHHDGTPAAYPGLYGLRNTGKLAGTFRHASYWSCSWHHEGSKFIYTFNFATGKKDVEMDSSSTAIPHACRPVRFEPRKGSAPEDFFAGVKLG